MKINISDYYDVLNNNFVLVCTSNDIEKEAVNKVLTNRQNLEINMNTAGCSIGMLSDQFVVHLSGESGIGKERSISRLIIHFLGDTNIPNPAQVTLCGFCWGSPEKTKIGDILLSSRVISLNHQIVEGDKISFKENVTTSTIETHMLEKALLSINDNIVMGDIISLETLYASTEKRNQLLQKYPYIIGGEMEAFAFVPSTKNIPWLVVKSVSDNGDDAFDQSFQETAASLAASCLDGVIKAYIDNDFIMLNTSTAENLSLVHRLVGKTLKIPLEKLSDNNLNDYLNDVIGPQVEYKLNYYASSDDYDNRFVKHMCDLILEVVQNSIKYSGPSKIEVTFNEKNIIIDDGAEYSLTNLNGNRGGATSWRRVKQEYIDTNKLTYSLSKKKHKFNLTKVNENINRIISDCSVIIVKEKIGSSWISNKVLSYDDSCESVFVDDRQVRMQSRRNSLVVAVKQLIDSGKIVYVAVNDSEDAEQYYRLKLKPESLKILVRPK